MGLRTWSLTTPWRRTRNTAPFWEKLVGRAKLFREFDGLLHIARPTDYSNAHIRQTGQERNLDKVNTPTQAAEVAEAVKKADVAILQHVCNVNQERPPVPVDLEYVEVADINRSFGKHLLDADAANNRVMNATSLQGCVVRELKQRELQQAKQDNEDMEDVNLQASD